MSEVLVAGADGEGVAEALRSRGVSVTEIDGTETKAELEAVGVASADALVVTEAHLATVVAVAVDINPDLRIVFYTRDSVPEFIKGQAGHILDPKLFDPDAVAEELD
ncbi:MAG: CTP synthetase [Natronomonas sp.]